MSKKNNLFALWLLGPTSSGKTTIASALHKKLVSDGLPVLHFDGDEIRDILGSGLGFSKRDRLGVVKNLVYFANKVTDSGVNVIVSALTASVEARSYVNSNTRNLVLGYVATSIETCMERDPKGLYRKAINGEIDTLIGYNSPYLRPEKYDLKVSTEGSSVDEIVDIIVNIL